MPSELEQVLAELDRAIQNYQSSVDDFDRETARLLGVNETDLRCLELLLMADELSPRELSTRLGLTTGSVTAMLDRLEKMGLLTRTPHPVDRRRSVVRVTPSGARGRHELLAPHVEEGHKELGSKYSAEQLRLVTDFLRTNTEIRSRYVARLRGLPSPKPQRGRGTSQ